jgi:hypothetical protein
MRRTLVQLAAATGLLGWLVLVSAPVAAQVSLNIQFNGNRPYYIDAQRHRHYMTEAQARDYYRKHDPHWYAAHQRDWQSNRGKFSQDWHHDHH